MKKILIAICLLFTINSFSQTYDLYRIYLGDPSDTTYLKRATDSLFRRNFDGSFWFSNELSYQQYSPYWLSVANPTTLSGYGIIDAYTITNLQTSGQSSINWANLISKPTTISGYGIMDAYTKTQSDAQYASLTGSYSNPSWITALAWAKLTGVPTILSFNTITAIGSAGRNFNQGYQISTTKYSDVRISVSISNSLTLSGGSSGQVILEISPDNATWTTVATTPNASTGTVIVGIATSAIGGGQLSCVVAPGSYWRARTNNVSGTPTYSFLNGVEILYN